MNMTDINLTLKNFATASVAVLMALVLAACESTAEARADTNNETVATDTISATDTMAVDGMNAPQMEGASGTLIINVTGYEAQTGQIMVAVYNDEAAFDDEAAPLRDAKVAINAAQTVVTFEDLPTGDFAFKIFHDENSNGTLDTNSFGMPKESYAFSMDASDPFSAPEFEESKFILKKGENIRNVSFD